MNYRNNNGNNKNNKRDNWGKSNNGEQNNYRVDKNAILEDYKMDYVKAAEKAIKNLQKNAGKSIVTTSKIRNLLALTASIYNDVNDPVNASSRELSDEIISQIQYLKIRFIYEAGREISVKKLVEEACILEVIDGIGTKKENYIKFSRYMEALVAYRKYLIGRDS